MDWSPPSKNRNGREAVGPHDSRTGWSYWVTIPSWDVRPISKDSDPDVDYGVHVDLRSPEGITKTSCKLKKLRDFKKLMIDLEKKFPNNKALRRLKTRSLLNKEWITKLLSDIDLSRSFEVASFLQLEAAVSAFHSEDQDVNPQNSEANSHEMPTQSNLPAILGSSSIKSDYASDTAYGKAKPGTPRIRKDANSEIDVNVVGKDVHVGRTSETSLLYSNYRMDLLSEPEHRKVIVHARKLLSERVASVVTSLRGSKISNSVIPNSSGDGSISRLEGAEASSSRDILGNLDLCGSFHPLDMVKTDMKYLEARLEQVKAVRIYHEAKIKELEGQQEIERHKFEALNQVLTAEKDKNISLRWEMDELRQTSLKMKLELEAKSGKEELLLRELSSIKEQQKNVSKQYEKKKADCKALVREVKRLRHVQRKLEEEKSEAEKLLQQVKQNIKQAEDANIELQHQSELFDLLKNFKDEIGVQLTEVTKALTEAGLGSSNLILGIDFTKSNEWTGKASFNNRSLHALGSTLNTYEKAISIIGKTLAPFNERDLIYCFGFGEASTLDQEVFSFHEDNLPCDGFEEALSCYRKLVPNLKLGGPTSYAPIVDAAIHVVEKSSGQYHVLFVIFNDNARESTSSSHETNFAHDALKKIPDQFKTAKKRGLLGKTTGKARKVLPLPPPVRYSHPLLSDTPASLLANDKDSEPHMTTCTVCWSRAIDTAFGCGHTVSYHKTTGSCSMQNCQPDA
ncbi:hypothetical protein TIFTF001_015037 [Ficus carica]|uniref:Copine C-terminal domain-containing protein n=1 Tax=Ficus carica TaxID=3494 RepID=A0AA88AS31_FICCA|nr:hypothetical protein TIFTF001_015037 [Ficus carica]